MSLKVLGIETSCDETAAAVVEGHPDGAKRVASSVVLSQLDAHAPYAGVVPEIAARAHIDHLDGLIEQALSEAGVRLADLDGIAATAGPGLIGGVMVGLMTAKALAAATGKPLIAVNHLEGHALTVRLTDDDVPFPYLLLLVSGGHTQLLIAEGVGDYRLLGTTIDDAIGEAFDKTAKMLGLPFPGGPAIDRWAQQGDPNRFKFPKPLTDRDGCDFSLSGLKTAVRREVEKIGGADGLPDADIADVAASFQRTIGDIVMNRIGNALEIFRNAHPEIETVPLVVAGGVAANSHLRARLQDLEQNGVRLIAPPLKLCTDNAAMIAWAGLEHLARGEVASLDVSARARWPLAEL